MGRDHPQGTVEVDLGPRHPRGFVAANRCQEQEARKRTGGIGAFYLRSIADFALCRLPHEYDLGIGQDALSRLHLVDEVAGLDQMTRVVLQPPEFAGDTEAVDLRCQCKRLGRHVGAGARIDLFKHGDDVTALDLGDDAGAPSWDQMPVDRLPDLRSGALLGGGRSSEKLLSECTESVPTSDERRWLQRSLL